MRTLAAGTLLVNRLLAAQRRLVGIELFGGGLDRAEVKVGGHFSLVAIVAQHRLQDIVHALGEHAFHPAAVVELLPGLGQRGILNLIGQQVALLVDDGDLGFVQFRHAGGDQVDNRHHLPGFQRAAWVQLDQYRGAGLAFITHEHRAFRNGQVHACALDVVEAGYGTGQFTFQAAAVTGGFHELAGAQALLLVEQLEADIAVARRHAGGCQFQARTGEVVGLDQQGPRVGLHVIGDVSSGQGVHDLLGVHARQAAVQRTVIGLLRPQPHGKADGHAGRQADQEADLAQHGHLRDIFQKRHAKQRRLGRWGASLGGGVFDDCFSHGLHPSSNRHLHDVLIRLDQLVAYLGQGLHRHAGLLRSDHHVSQVDAALADFERVGQLGRSLLRLMHLADGLAEHVGEGTLPWRQLGGGGCLGQRHGIGLHGPHVQHQTIEFNTLAHDPSLSCGRIFLTVMRRMTYVKQQRCQPCQSDPM